MVSPGRRRVEHCVREKRRKIDLPVSSDRTSRKVPRAAPKGSNSKSKSAEQVLYLLCGAFTYKLCASNVFPVRMFQQFPPVRSPDSVKLICRFDYPSSSCFEKLHPHRVAVATQRMAVGHPSFRTKFSGARRKNQRRTLLPPPHANHARSLGADVFRKRRFHAGQMPVAVEYHGNLHRNAIFAARKGVDVPERHCSSSSQARGDARDGIHGITAMLHAVERAVSSAQKLFGGIAVFGIRGNSRAHRKRGFFVFR